MPCSRRSGARSRCSARTARRRAPRFSVAFSEYRTLSREASTIRAANPPTRPSGGRSARPTRSGSIADREYGDPRGWRLIAEASDVDDPRALRPGDWLRVPPLEEDDGADRRMLDRSADALCAGSDVALGARQRSAAGARARFTQVEVDLALQRRRARSASPSRTRSTPSARISSRRAAQPVLPTC